MNNMKVYKLCKRIFFIIIIRTYTHDTHTPKLHTIYWNPTVTTWKWDLIKILFIQNFVQCFVSLVNQTTLEACGRKSEMERKYNCKIYSFWTTWISHKIRKPLTPKKTLKHTQHTVCSAVFRVENILQYIHYIYILNPL